MQKKIYKVMTWLVAVTVIVITVIVGSLSYSFYQKASKQELKSAADIIVKTHTTPADAAKVLKDSVDFEVRVTMIAADGTVEYDSQADAGKMENHSDRKEFKLAVENGSAETTRFSDTLGYTTYYYALTYNGGVLRFSTDRSNLGGFFVTMIPIFIAFAGAIIFVTTIISIRLSEGLIRPINQLVKQLDLRNENIGELETPYEELEPVIRNADVLMKRITKNLRKIKSEKDKITLITANMVEGMIMLDEELVVLSMNKSADKIMSLHFDKKEKDHIRKYTSNEKLLELIFEARDSGTANGIFEHNNRFYNLFANRVRNEDNVSEGIIVFFADVTEIVQSEQMRRDFSANVSHELKTPLTTIKGFGEMLDNGIFSDPEDVKKYGGMIYRESERLLLLINDIIRLSEIEDKEHLLTDNVDLMQTASDVEEILSNKAQSHNVTIHLAGEKVSIRGHQGYMTELFLNLMDNAVKYNKDGGEAWVTVSKQGGRAVVVFEDNGIGIDDDSIGRVFERFYRVDKSRSKQTGGTGLGLSIVKHIVNYHDGSIEISSKLGEGTKITAQFPLKLEDSAK